MNALLKNEALFVMTRSELGGKEEFSFEQSEMIKMEPLSDDIKGCSRANTNTRNVQRKKDGQSICSFQRTREKLMPENLSNFQRVKVEESSFAENDHGSNTEGDLGLQEEDRIACHFSSFKANSHSALKLNHHINSRNSEKPSVDSSSSCKTQRRACLKRRNIPAAAKDWSCKLCSFKAMCIFDLKKHALIHTGEKSFACELCSFKTDIKLNLKTHLSNHTSGKPFTCELCSYKTNRRQSLKDHILTHTGEKPLSCEFCSYRTIQKSHLKTHIITHTGEKAFACEFCSFKTYQKQNLKVHLLTHTGEKPFACGFCSYKANQKQNLKKHYLTHTGEKPFNCELCSYKTNHKQNLKRHLVQHVAK